MGTEQVRLANKPEWQKEVEVPPFLSAPTESPSSQTLSCAEQEDRGVGDMLERCCPEPGAVSQLWHRYAGLLLCLSSGFMPSHKHALTCTDPLSVCLFGRCQTVYNISPLQESASDQQMLCTVEETMQSHPARQIWARPLPPHQAVKAAGLTPLLLSIRCALTPRFQPVAHYYPVSFWVQLLAHSTSATLSWRACPLLCPGSPWMSWDVSGVLMWGGWFSHAFYPSSFSTLLGVASSSGTPVPCWRQNRPCMNEDSKRAVSCALSCQLAWAVKRKIRLKMRVGIWAHWSPVHWSGFKLQPNRSNTYFLWRLEGRGWCPLVDLLSLSFLQLWTVSD